MYEPAAGTKTHGEVYQKGVISARLTKNIVKKCWQRRKRMIEYGTQMREETLWAKIRELSKDFGNKAKKLEKSLKKVLTKGNESDILLKLSRRDSTEHWKLNNDKNEKEPEIFWEKNVLFKQ